MTPEIMSIIYRLMLDDFSMGRTGIVFFITRVKNHNFRTTNVIGENEYNYVENFMDKQLNKSHIV